MKKILLLSIFFVTTVLVGPVFAGPEHNHDEEIFGVGGNKEEIDELNDRIAEKREKIKQLEETIAEYKEQIDAKRSESVSLSNQIAVLDNKSAQVELDIEATQTKLDTLELEIESLNLSIEDKELSIGRQQLILSELLRDIHQNQSKNYIEILAAYDNFSDFYNRLQYVRTVERDLGRSARGLRLAKEELEDKKTQSEEIKTSYEQVKEELDNKKKDLEEQSEFRYSLLAQTQSSELKYKTLVDSLKSQYQAIENEISGIEREVRQRLEANDKLENIESADGSLLSWPVPSRYITCGFHCGGYPYAQVFQHSGMDIRASHGTPLKAAASGYVARAKRCADASCYSFVMIIHADGIATVYGHMSGITVQEDQFVTRGDIIGYSGGTPGTVGAGPFVTGAHLHFEVRRDGIPVDPLPFMIRDY